MKIGLAQINTVVGDLPGNRRKILDGYRALVSQGAELTVFPELAVCGYPPRDLLFKRRFVPDNETSLTEIAAEIGEVPAVIGFVETNPSVAGRRFFNAAAWCHRGAVVKIGRKCLLPTYDVFDEDRYFEAAGNPVVVEHAGRRIGLSICEDLWFDPELPTGRLYQTDPVIALASARIDLLVNLSASPWHCGKNELRRNLVTAAAVRCGCPVIYCNAVGGNDELIFDGRSFAADSDGRLLAGLPAFEEAVRVVDLNGAKPDVDPTFHQDELQDIEDALVLGLRDYAHKSGFRTALVGLSGGIDSAVTAALAARALGPDNVTGVSLPSSISSDHSRMDARALAENLGISFHTLPISPVVATAEETLEPVFKGKARDIAEENIQARARGLLLMAMSNKFGSLLLTTGNKSELAVGYCTLYGDMCGGLAVISDLPKTNVYALARHLNREREVIPESSITKPPSAELRPDQTDQDSLPEYDILDRILEGYVGDGLSSIDLIDRGFPPDVVRDIIRKVDLNEYKRKQAAPGLKITPLAFGVGRRIPIVQRYVG